MTIENLTEQKIELKNIKQYFASGHNENKQWLEVSFIL